MQVALLDSGIGGWSFYTKIKSQFPEHTYSYFADQKNCPYGNKSYLELEQIAEDWIDLLKEKQIDVLVIACNTLTALFKDKFKEELNIPVIGTTDGLEKNSYSNEDIVLLATVKTVQSSLYEKVLPTARLHKVGNTWLAAKIEKSFALTPEELQLLKQEVESLVGTQWRKLILGCTHYPLVKDYLKIVWPTKEFIDPAVTIVNELNKYLHTDTNGRNQTLMYTTGDVKVLNEQVSTFFKENENIHTSSVRIEKVKGRIQL